MKIEELNRQLETLKTESAGARAGTGHFDPLLERATIRLKCESLASKYIMLLDSKDQGSEVSLRILEVLELFRARDIGLKMIRTASIGPNKRPLWRKIERHNTSSHTAGKVQGHSSQVRTFQQASVEINGQKTGPLDTGWQDFAFLDSTRDYARQLDFSRVLILHLGFVGDALVAALDENAGIFVYGDSFNTPERRVEGSAFADYGYDASSLSPDGIIYGPSIQPGARPKLTTLTEKAHQVFSSPIEGICETFFLELSETLDRLLNYEALTEAISGWAKAASYDLKDIILVIIPDETLYLLPLSFLGASHGRPWITQLGGISIAFNLLAFKWAVKDYHWTTQPNMSKQALRCSFFAASNPPGLDLASEMAQVVNGFGGEHCNCFGMSANRADFLQNYSAGEVCWFAGHGGFDVSQGLDVGGTVLPFPLSGPSLADGILSNWELLFTSNWNFKPLWLTVWNSCVLGKSILLGPNPLGFMSALHSAGSVAAVSPLWPIGDRPAIRFAEHYSRELAQGFGKREFLRAEAFSLAIGQCIEEGDAIWKYAPYALWGVP